MLAPGALIGKYEIVERIGAGGMGEVWKARDTVLGRDVAIKALSPELAGDSERLARLEREAKVLASLNHPNIAGIRGLERSEGSSFLELELVEGETLSDLLQRGPVAVGETLTVALQIAEALEAAHAQGIVHRDLKPGNVMLRPDGTVKVLDFGLAKTSRQSLSQSAGPEIPTASLTQEGTIVGTPAYMSPEQVRGRTVDAQTDIWAFGCILFEMLTGWSPFGGPSQVETLGRVLERNPDLDALPAETPALIRRLIRRCLEKEPRNRLHHISDARLEIREARDAPPDAASSMAGAGQGPRSGRQAMWIGGFGAAALVVAGFAWLLADRPAASPPEASAVFAVGPPVPAPLVISGDRGVAVSPDGTRIAYVSDGSIWLQTLGRQDAERITAGSNPFFSADGASIGFLGGGGNGLSRMSLAERAVIPVTEGMPSGRFVGGTWRGETIIFATQTGVFSIPASEEGAQATLLIPAPEGQTLGWPHLLPDGNTVLLTALSGNSAADSRIVLLDLETLEVSGPLVRGAVGARYAPVGPDSAAYLVYANAQNRLVAREFDPVLRQIGPTPIEIPDVAVQIAGTFLGAAFDVSETGSLVHIRPRETRPMRAAWVDHDGNEELLAATLPGVPTYPRISPEGDRIALTIGVGTTGRRVWVMDRERGVPVQLSDRDAGGALYEEFESIWSPDGERIYFTSMRSGEMRIWSHAADGSGVDEMLVDDPNVLVPLEALPDGRLFVMRTVGGALDIGILDPAEPGTIQWLAESPFSEAMPTVSPDGRWMAYASNELGNRFDVYVQPLLSDSPRLRVSANGGVFPVWDPSGNGTLYFIGRDGTGEPAMLSALLDLSSEPRVVEEQTLFYRDDLGSWVDGGMLRPFDISPTDGRFLLPLLDQSEGSDQQTLWVMLNWAASL